MRTTRTNPTARGERSSSSSARWRRACSGAEAGAHSTKGQPDTSNARDGIYQGGGSQLLVTPAAEGSGYGVTFDLALQY